MKKEKAKTKPQEKQKKLLISTLPKSYFLIAAVVTFVFLFPVIGNGFINFDDPQYVLENQLVQHPDKEAIKTIFSGQVLGNYQPLVLLSYAFQYKMFGMDSAKGYHTFSLIMHVLNTLLVLLIAFRLLKNPLGALFAALLFGVHPLHVESVAWVAAQKDTFYVFFFLGSIWFYLKYLETKKMSFMILCFLAFGLSVFSKAQAVVLPIVLILIDLLENRQTFLKKIVQKIPFLLVSVIFGIIAIKSQQSAGAVQDAVFSFADRFLFASYGFENYLLQTVLPYDLAIFYPYPETNLVINSNWVYLGPIIVIGATVAAFYFGKKHPMILFGYLFFCVNIALVIQLLPVGDAIRADRYTYLSLVGFFLIGGYLISKWQEKSPDKKTVIMALVGGVTLVFGVLSFSYAKKWSDSITIYTHALEKHPAPIVYCNRAAALHKEGRMADAILDFDAAIAIKPQFPNAYKNRGLTHESLGEHQKAVDDLTNAIQYRPNDLDIYFTRGNILKNANNVQGAWADFSKVIELNPNVVDAWQNRAECYYKLGKLNEALADLNQAIKMKPDYAGAFFNRSITLRDMGNIPGALQDAQSAAQYGFKVDPGYLQDLQSRMK